MNFPYSPILKALIPYVLGVVFGFFLPINSLNLLFCILGLFIFSMIFIVFRKKKEFFLRNTITVLLFFSFAFAGYLSIFSHFHKNIKEINIEKITQKQTWIAEVVELPREREKSFKVIAKLSAVGDSTYWITNRTVLYFYKNYEIEKWNVGDKFIINTKLSFIDPPKNPYQFDYNKFMKMRGIYLTGYIGEHFWTKIVGGKKNSVKRYASYLQRFLSEKLEEAGLTGSEYSVTVGILLGNEDTIEPELKASYAAAGVSHILSVSGMHVGIIFMILNFLLQPFGNKPKVNYIRSAILLIAVWFYVNITGLSPPAVRSAAMFTFVIAGNLLQRRTHILQSLVTSLFILLVLNPVLLFDVGFELSYLAMFGIVIYQKIIAKWLKPKSKFGKYIWDLVTVSLAAQLTTSPIAIYYFAQFPNYFLLTNLCVVALSTLMMITGVATLAVSFNSFLSNGLGFILSFEVKVMNEIILFIEQLPGAVTTHISVNFSQVIILYVGIVICCFLLNNIKKLLISLLMLLNIFLVIHNESIVKNKHHINIVNYTIPKSAAFQFCHHGNAVIFSDSIQNESDKRYQFSIKNHNIKKQLKNEFVKFDEDFENSFLCKKGNFIIFRDTVYYIEKNRLKPNTVNLVVYNNNFSERSIYKLK